MKVLCKIHWKSNAKDIICDPNLQVYGNVILPEFLLIL
jgi:hypothetical protein